MSSALSSGWCRNYQTEVSLTSIRFPSVSSFLSLRAHRFPWHRVTRTMIPDTSIITTIHVPIDIISLIDRADRLDAARRDSQCLHDAQRTSTLSVINYSRTFRSSASVERQFFIKRVENGIDDSLLKGNPCLRIEKFVHSSPCVCCNFDKERSIDNNIISYKRNVLFNREQVLSLTSYSFDRSSFFSTNLSKYSCKIFAVKICLI